MTSQALIHLLTEGFQLDNEHEYSLLVEYLCHHLKFIKFYLWTQLQKTLQKNTNCFKYNNGLNNTVKFKKKTKTVEMGFQKLYTEEKYEHTEE